MEKYSIIALVGVVGFMTALFFDLPLYPDLDNAILSVSAIAVLFAVIGKIVSWAPHRRRRKRPRRHNDTFVTYSIRTGRVRGAHNHPKLSRKQEMERRYELLIFKYTNNKRVKRGLYPLVLSKKISRVARLHSQDMLRKGFVSHDNLKGQDPTDRGNRQGVSPMRDYGSYYTGLGENIFYLPDHKVSNVVKNSKTMVNGWMKSRGHRENILNGNYALIGIGIKFSNYKIYATQNFC